MLDLIIRWSLFIVVAVVGIGFSQNVLFKKKKAEVIEIEEPVVKRKIKREVASVEEDDPSSYEKRQKVIVDELTPINTENNQDMENDLSDPASPAPAKSETVESEVGTEGSASSAPSSVATSRPGGQNSRSPGSTKPVTTTTTTKTTTSQFYQNPGTYLGPATSINFTNKPSTPTTTTNTTTPTGTSSGTSSNTSGGTDSFSCSASVGDGVFGNPIQVSLSCSTTATIKYCLQEGSCCDPENTGTTYSSPIVIGEKNGAYCLSFFGKGSVTQVTGITKSTYTIDSTYPDLLITWPQTYYQTTEYSGAAGLKSNDFGKNQFYAGEINLKSHDPGPSGLSLSCKEIVEKHSILSSPSTDILLDPLHFLGLTSGQEVEVPFVLTDLDYGENFITSYVMNRNFPAPIYSCSTNKITLMDFEFFTPEITHGDSGSNSIREFSGGFVSYGFFEADTDVNRTPAGGVNEDNNGQKLQVGSFGVFY